MADDEDIAALVIDNGSGMCKGKKTIREKEMNNSKMTVMMCVGG